MTDPHDGRPPGPETVHPPDNPSTVSHDAARTHPPGVASALRAGAAPAHLPAAFGRYRLEQVLGKGGMGAVYLAYDTQLDRRVALKVPVFGPDDGSLRERFFREARAAATLQHPNLCPVFDVGEHEGVYYLTMAYIEGKPLSAYVNPDKPLRPVQAAGLVRVLAKALQEAHDHGVIHRDLKPANVMIGRKKQPVIMDFGLARRAASQDARLTHSGALMGTPAYMPPEQVNGDVAAMGPGCDIYSLGVILYELLTGRRPFDGPMGVLMARILIDPPPPPTDLRPDLDPALAAICLRALAKRPADRFASMRAFAAALDDWLAGKSAPPPVADSNPQVAVPARPVLAVAAPAPPPTPRPPPDEDDDDEPIRKRRPRTKRPAARGGSFSSTQKSLLLVSGIVFVLCVLPAGGVALLVYETVNAVSDGVSRTQQFVQDMKKEEERHQVEEKAEQRQWEDLARTWQPPAGGPGPVSFPPAIGAYRLAEADSRAEVPELNVGAVGQRGVYRRDQVTVEVFAYRASELEKEAILKRAQDAAYRVGAPPNHPLVGSNVRGSPDGTYLTYALAATGGKPAQYGTFWWDEGWLFLARGGTPKEPGAMLKEYLAAVGRSP